MQSEYWKDNHDYHERVKENKVGSVESNIELFRSILGGFYHVKEIDSINSVTSMNIHSVLELGAGTGQNIKAIKELYEDLELWSVEINPQAANEIPHGNVICGDVLTCNIPKKCDLTFTKGLAIHIHPDNISKLYQRLYDYSNEFILMCEYYSPRREEIEYRGEMGKLWKANFYDEMMEQHPDLELINYGFVGHWDACPQDDLTWWMWRKGD